MDTYDKNDPKWKPICDKWGEINSELDLLKGKTDAASVERYYDLVEQLMCVDMMLKPMRHAMVKASRETATHRNLWGV